MKTNHKSNNDQKNLNEQITILKKRLNLKLLLSIANGHRHATTLIIAFLFSFLLQKPEIVVGDGNGIIVPIVIGALIAVVVLIVLIFFIVRRKKTQNKYDCDVSDKSENKKLNDQEEA